MNIRLIVGTFSFCSWWSAYASTIVFFIPRCRPPTPIFRERFAELARMGSS
ncbi:MAG: hypothetical protein IPK28_06360 [Devosia sp.]|nr:hypothetical protein [Devosia sp.]